mmetsp:Transcript_16225/g.25195  ORF Transcript_16225/g.25195 Transcript_16225/m.25195 type:complete len:94 (-) Transcript_16225:98-379(-)
MLLLWGAGALVLWLGCLQGGIQRAEAALGCCAPACRAQEVEADEGYNCRLFLAFGLWASPDPGYPRSLEFLAFHIHVRGCSKLFDQEAEGFAS